MAKFIYFIYLFKIKVQQEKLTYRNINNKIIILTKISINTTLLFNTD